ncbi:RNA polymerase sigma factor FliA [Methylomonas sp. MED-D]|nr:MULTISPECIES: RNA polymerase sigma factor FliA [Methylomonas]MDT4330282.1 RNA polymerase sigma factor FliA [Methylomonas sp. MV1]NJA08421.1 RNA polymerase sigma factor FliA [Methylococcaceae bacterium WWC4]WGS86577.1 RNA polymerase sigma factor FliA [Methylomonas sp. UP202]
MSGAAMYAAVQAGNLDNLVIQHAPLVKRIAYHLMGRLPDTVQIDDMIQSGMLGLLEALKHYDAAQGASFETYAGIRIRGAMLDELRRSDWTPRSVHKKARAAAEAIRDVESRLGRDAKDSEVARQMGISLEEYGRILQDAMSCKTFSVEELVQGEDGVIDAVHDGFQPEEALIRQSFQQALAKAIAELPERERLVISLYYDDELNLREIGKVLDVSESRVSQICSQALLRLRARLADWLEGTDNEKSG